MDNDFRILRPESGPQALDTLRELRLSGDEAALNLADQGPGIPSELASRIFDRFPFTY